MFFQPATPALSGLGAYFVGCAVATDVLMKETDVSAEKTAIDVL